VRLDVEADLFTGSRQGVFTRQPVAAGAVPVLV
jgi:hypothetical protein